MCGRYVSPDEASIEREFNLVRSEWQFPANFNTAPSQAVPAIRCPDGSRHGVLLRWGLVPYWWSKPLKEAKIATFNARVETVDTTPFFSLPLLSSGSRARKANL